MICRIHGWLWSILRGGLALLGLSCLDEVVVAALLLEQLREVDLAVEDPVERGVGGRRQDAAPVRALEAVLVVRFAFQRHLYKNIYISKVAYYFICIQRSFGKILAFIKVTTGQHSCTFSSG
jgi:hypothetical protein